MIDGKGKEEEESGRYKGKRQTKEMDGKGRTEIWMRKEGDRDGWARKGK